MVCYWPNGLRSVCHLFHQHHPKGDILTLKPTILTQKNCCRTPNNHQQPQKKTSDAEPPWKQRGCQASPPPCQPLPTAFLDPAAATRSGRAKPISTSSCFWRLNGPKAHLTWEILGNCGKAGASWWENWGKSKSTIRNATQDYPEVWWKTGTFHQSTRKNRCYKMKRLAGEAAHERWGYYREYSTHTSSAAQGGGGSFKNGSLLERLVVVNHGWQSESTDGPTGGWSYVFWSGCNGCSDHPPQLLDVVWCRAVVVAVVIVV